MFQSTSAGIVYPLFKLWGYFQSDGKARAILIMPNEIGVLFSIDHITR